MSTLLKCKMCGGTLEIQENETVARCKYCGSLMTLPKIDSDKKARIFNRANEYRLNNDFDKAYDAYKAIVEEDPTEAEAYWGMILSEYGIEYVEDPKTGERIPTCHRTQTTPVVNNPNFQMALKYADSERRMMYQDEAETLDKLQRSILSVSTKEEPYDVFISYKETDDVTGERTEDSVIAQDIYNELNRAGIRTFFSRITLADHLGENYEPYIYAALQSSKILLTVSTRPEHLESTWVKNEWMRFLRMKDKEPSRMIIPVYKNMSPYGLPTVLSAFQSQDMAKIGAVQELVQGVERILNRKELSEKDILLNQLLEKQKKEIEKQRKLALEREQKEKEALAIENRKKEIALKEEAERKERKQIARKRFKKIALPCAIVIFLIGAVIGYLRLIRPISIYEQASQYENNNELDKAAAEFARITFYKDSSDKASNLYYSLGEASYLNSEFEKSKNYFLEARNYSVSDYNLARADIYLCKINDEVYPSQMSTVRENNEYVKEVMSLKEDGDKVTQLKNTLSVHKFGFEYFKLSNVERSLNVYSGIDSVGAASGTKIAKIDRVGNKKYRCFYKCEHQNNTTTYGIILEDGTKGYVRVQR